MLNENTKYLFFTMQKIKLKWQCLGNGKNEQNER